MDLYAHTISSAHDGAVGLGKGKGITAEQARTGNYRKGRLTLHGLPIAIETPAGMRRTGKTDGELWSVICMAHYGDISGTKGADGDPLDVFVGPWPESERVYVINRGNKSGSFDEHKIMLGFVDASSAINAYRNSYERGADGIQSWVPCSIEQLKWWIKFGDTSRPLTADSLPFDGSTDMNEVAWDNNANPIGTDLPGLMYSLRRQDSGEGLLLDSVTVQDILDDSEGEITLDALVIPMNRLERKMTQMQLAMRVAGESVKPVAMQITPPFKQRGSTNIAVIYELSDGQTLTVIFHNPDTTPNKITPDDELVSWKWLLNKRDVTIVVAPERGRDLNPREVARRVIRLAERNSARFQAANTKRAERMASIEARKTSVEAKQATLDDLYRQIDEAEAQIEQRRTAQAAPAALQNEVRDQTGEAVAGTNVEAAPAQATVQEQSAEVDELDVKLRAFAEKTNNDIYDPSYRGGSWLVKSVETQETIEDFIESSNRWAVKTPAQRGTIAGLPFVSWEQMQAAKGQPRDSLSVVDFGSKRFAISYDLSDFAEPQEPNPTQDAAPVADIDPTDATGYAIAKEDEALLLKYQDMLDSFFQERIVAVRNAMGEKDWFGTAESFSKSSAPDVRFTYAVESAGAGNNVVGVKYQLLDQNDVEVFSIVDDLSKTPAEIAAELDAAAPQKEVSNNAIDWYERRDELEAGMIFATSDGIVKLDRRVPGDGTKWYVLDWNDGWSHWDSTIEPGDLQGEPLLNFETEQAGKSAQAAQTGAETPATAERQESVTTLQSVIDGTANLDDVDLPPKLFAIYEKYPDDAEIQDLFDKATRAFSDHMVAKARSPS